MSAEGRELLGKLTDLPGVEISGNIIAIGGVRFHPNKVTMERKCKLEDAAMAGIFVQRAQQSNLWWLGDWSLAMESFGEEAAQYISTEHFTEAILKRARWVCTKIEPVRRVAELAFEHHAAVAKLDSDGQDRWLKRALAKNLSVQDLRRAMRKHDHDKRYIEQDMPEGRYRVIYVDFPWQYNDSGVITDNDAYGRAERHYPTMELDTIVKFAEAEIKNKLAAKNCVLFLWVPAPLIITHAPPVITAAGFVHKAGFVWDKVAHNFGHYNSARHEHLLICTRGKMVPDAEVASTFDSVQTIERSDTHSEKPEEFRAIIDTLYPSIKKHDRVELFARANVPEPWVRWGNEAPDGKLAAAGGDDTKADEAPAVDVTDKPRIVKGKKPAAGLGSPVLSPEEEAARKAAAPIADGVH